jgi:hypothetical protein
MVKQVLNDAQMVFPDGNADRFFTRNPSAFPIILPTWQVGIEARIEQNLHDGEFTGRGRVVYGGPAVSSLSACGEKVRVFLQPSRNVLFGPGLNALDKR